MMMLSWNIRGLGAKIKRSAIRKLIYKHDPKVVCIQETKIESCSQKLVGSIWNDPIVSWAASPSTGSSGGIITQWNKDFFVANSITQDQHWIALLGVIPSINLQCIIINVYCPCSINERLLVWQSILDFWISTGLPGLLIGDFNEVLHANERGSQSISTNGSNDFNKFLQEIQVVEIPPSNGKFTWFRGQSKS